MAITFRDLKGSALTHQEMDTNLASYFLSSSVSGSTITFFKSGSDGLVVSSSHDLADSDSQTLSIVTDQLTISNGNTITVPTGSDTTYTAGDDLSLVGTVFNNTAPDQTVTIAGVGSTAVTGTYPNFTISSSNTNDNTEYTAGTGLNLTGTEFSNTAPDQTVTIAGSGSTSVFGTYPNFTISSVSDDTNLARIISGVYDSNTQTLVFTRDDSTTFSLDASMFFDDTNLVTSVNGSTGAVTVPTGSNTTYTAGTGLTLTGTVFSNDITNNNQLTNGAGYITSFTDTNTQLSDSDIAAFGYIKTYTDTNTQLSDSDIASFGYIKTASSTDTLQDVTSRGNTTSTTITAANFITTSDRRLKSNITPIQEGLETIKKFISYEYEKDGIQDAGFIAQEVQEAIPYSIAENDEGYLTMRDRPVLAHMHKAILELEARLSIIEEKLK